jgi:general secretion pathway protein G
MLSGQHERKGEIKMNCFSLKKQKGATKMKRGFTLIELMIVIAVMAILIGISLPHFKGMQDEGRSAKAAGELRTLTIAIESFNIHHDEYPVQTLSVNFTDWQTDANSITYATPRIVKKALKDPFDSSRQYSYATDAGSGESADYYIVFSVGPDGTADITAISTAGVISWTGVDPNDDIYITNAESGVGGF